ncbi:MAG TPA: LamG-like jellyroll fold domain-containing protein [Dissulfurispiraceae bacterium]|nr:LamG-like jellyroll fold domain-containing protein [Dissulfurispiraceae bacterium]
MACFNFTGSNYASISALSTNLLGGGGSFTVSCRVYPLSYDGTYRSPFGLYASGTNNVGLSIPRDASAQVVRLIGSVNGASATENTTIAATASTWAIYTLVWDQSALQLKIYKNGVLGHTKQLLGGFESVASTPLYVGALAGGTYRYNSKTADIRLYSAVVTPNHAVLATSESNLVAWYPYPNAAGNARDASGNGNHMTTTGGSLYSASGGPGLPWVTLP